MSARASSRSARASRRISAWRTACCRPAPAGWRRRASPDRTASLRRARARRRSVSSRRGGARAAGWFARYWWWSAPAGSTAGCAGLRGRRRRGWAARRRGVAARSALSGARRSDRPGLCPSGQITIESQRVTDTEPGGPPPSSTATTEITVAMRVSKPITCQVHRRHRHRSGSFSIRSVRSDVFALPRISTC